jgi:hypothetical protein
MSTPDDIKQDIERTRDDLRDDVSALEEKVSPRRVAQRSADRVKGSVGEVRDTLMGSADRSQTQVRESVGGAPVRLRRQTQGNPLAMGLAAFALGWLASSLLPPSQAERRAGKTLREESAQRAQPIGESARRVVEDVQEPLRQAVHDVGEQARESTQAVAEEAKRAASAEASRQG